MTRTERIVGNATGRALLWLGKRACDRRDWHEANHCLAALAVGASDHKDECGMPTDRPINARPRAVWDPYPPEPTSTPKTPLGAPFTGIPDITGDDTP